MSVCGAVNLFCCCRIETKAARWKSLFGAQLPGNAMNHLIRIRPFGLIAWNSGEKKSRRCFIIQYFYFPFQSTYYDHNKLQIKYLQCNLSTEETWISTINPFLHKFHLCNHLQYKLLNHTHSHSHSKILENVSSNNQLHCDFHRKFSFPSSSRHFPSSTLQTKSQFCLTTTINHRFKESSSHFWFKIQQTPSFQLPFTEPAACCSNSSAGSGSPGTGTTTRSGWAPVSTNSWADCPESAQNNSLSRLRIYSPLSPPPLIRRQKPLQGLLCPSNVLHSPQCGFYWVSGPRSVHSACWWPSNRWANSASSSQTVRLRLLGNYSDTRSPRTACDSYRTCRSSWTTPRCRSTLLRRGWRRVSSNWGKLTISLAVDKCLLVDTVWPF